MPETMSKSDIRQKKTDIFVSPNQDKPNNGKPNSPVEESLPAEHGRELLGHTLPDLLDGGRVAHESRRHLQALRRHVTD